MADLFDMLCGQDRCAGGDATENGDVTRTVVLGTGGRCLLIDDHDRPRLGGISFDRPGAHQCGQMECTVDGEERPTASPISHARGIASRPSDVCIRAPAADVP